MCEKLRPYFRWFPAQENVAQILVAHRLIIYDKDFSADCKAFLVAAQPDQQRLVQALWGVDCVKRVVIHSGGGSPDEQPLVLIPAATTLDHIKPGQAPLLRRLVVQDPQLR